MADRRPIPKLFFTTLEFREHSRLRPSRQFEEFNIAHAWAEAELFIISKLKEGEHPGVVNEILNTAITKSDGDAYRLKFIEFCIRILRNIQASNIFGNIASIKEYDEVISDDYVKKAEFEIRLTDICNKLGERLRVLALDAEMVGKLERTPEMDRETQETLAFLWELRKAEADEHYGDNKLLLQPTPYQIQLETASTPMVSNEVHTPTALSESNRTRSL